MAFWGQKLRPGQSGTLELPNGGILHLSQACLGDSPAAGTTFLQAKVHGETYNLCCLQKDVMASQTLDLFFSPGETTFLCKGTHELHISGYIEPDEADEEEPPPRGAAEDEKAAKRQPDDEGLVAPARKDGLQASPAAEVQQKPQATKRKAADDAVGSPAKKKGLEASSASAAAPVADTQVAGDAESEYIKQVVQFLKTNGMTHIGQLGSKLPKPDSIKGLRAFLDSHKDTFIVRDTRVELK
mmetsp:Transcript_21186/g.38672  ORF Transcript_21186/g.38672 Transcript_21186/m.38672 type:complete len:242 (-) Transcript_21186:24-749(-)